MLRRRLDQGLRRSTFKLSGFETNALLDVPRARTRPTALFRMGWIADYPSLDNFLYPVHVRGGLYGSYTFYSNPQVDALFEQARATADAPQRYDLYTRPRS